MTATTVEIEHRLAELRDSFDRSFAHAAQADVVDFEDLLAIRVAGEPYVVALKAIAGLATTSPVTPLPGAPPQLLGVAAVRRTIVAVYDLAAVLGHGGSAAPRWLVLAGGEPAVALAFDRVDGHLRLPRAAIAANAGLDGQDTDTGRRALAGDVVHTSTGARAVLDIPAVRAALVAAARNRDQGRKP